MPHPFASDLLTVAEAAVIVGKSVSTVHRWTLNGTVTNMGPLHGLKLISHTELRMKCLTPTPQKYRDGEWIPRRAV